MANLLQKRKLARLLGKLSPEGLDPSLLEGAFSEIEKVKDSIPQIAPVELSPIYQTLVEISTKISSQEELSKEEKKQINTSLKLVEEQLNKSTDKKINTLKLEILQLLSRQGGGSMNRKIVINGTDYLTRYTDINIIAPGATAANNNTKKWVDVTLSSSSGGTPYAEIPSGTINSSNVTFTLAHTPTATDGVIVVLDGVVQYNGDDYTVSGATITFSVAPTTGSTIFAYYGVLNAGQGTVTEVTSANANATVATTTTTPVITIVSAPKLQTARTIAGKSFDGTGNITIASTDLSDTSNIPLLDTAKTWTAAQTFKQDLHTINAITATSNAATVPITHKYHNVTNNSAATLTITLTTTSTVDGQVAIIRIYDFSAAAQTLAFVNTENSSLTVPTTSNGSTTLPLTVSFMFNGATSKWRHMGYV